MTGGAHTPMRDIAAALRRRASLLLQPYVRRLKAPRMIYGYLDSSGHWRPRTRMSDTVAIYAPERVSVEDNVYVGHYCLLDGTAGLKLSEGVQLAAWVGVYTHSSHIAIRLYGRHYLDISDDELEGYERRATNIGRYVHIGAHATILPGADIGEGAVVAAGSVVTGPVDAWSVVAGAPARVVGDTREMDEPYLDDPVLAAWHAEWRREDDGPRLSP
jgi:acetyltransferase-like isoleucine patch superfamily enzyme